MESMAAPGREPARPLIISPEDLPMDSKGLHDAIRTVAETGSFNRLFGYFADDTDLRISVALQSPASDSTHGRRSVIQRLQRLYSSDLPTSEEPVDVFSSGNRIVACCYTSVAIAGGLTVRDGCALLFRHPRWIDRTPWNPSRVVDAAR